MPSYDRPLSFIASELPHRPFLSKQGLVARWITRKLLDFEDREGRTALLPMYQQWQADLAAGEPNAFQRFLDLTKVEVEINDPHGSLEKETSGPMVVYANHIFGIHDGLILGAMCERMGRKPNFIAALNAMNALPELKPYCFEVDSRQPPKYVEMNNQAKAAAFQCLEDGGVMVICPSGRVASAKKKGEIPVEFPWKTFAARMVMASKADILPIFVHGNPGALANPAARRGRTMGNLSLLRMFFRFPNRKFRISVGPIRRYDELQSTDDRYALTREMRKYLFELSDGVAAGDSAEGEQP